MIIGMWVCEEDLVGNYGYTDPSFWHKSHGKLEIIQRLDFMFLKHMSTERRH